MSTVHFLDLRKSHKDNFPRLLEKLIAAADGLKIVKKDTAVAVKCHFGEDGNVNFVSPLYVRRVVELIRKAGGRPFLTDTTTLYSGRRFKGDTYLELAKEHGFDFAPIVIADGIFGDEYEDFDGAKIARLFKNIDTVFCVSHFKGHMVSGFGAAIKNLGMGCAAKGGKLAIHSNSKPFVDEKRCTACLKCLENCAYNAIFKSRDSVVINEKVCTGCAGCMSICPERAIRFSWNAASSDLQKGIARYTANLIKGKQLFCLTFMTNISPECDCFHTNEPVISPDIGILASHDPVAIDQAAYDFAEGAIKKLHPDIDAQEQMVFAEKFSAGEREYEIKSI